MAERLRYRYRSSVDIESWCVFLAIMAVLLFAFEPEIREFLVQQSLTGGH